MSTQALCRQVWTAENITVRESMWNATCTEHRTGTASSGTLRPGGRSIRTWPESSPSSKNRARSIQSPSWTRLAISGCCCPSAAARCSFVWARPRRGHRLVNIDGAHCSLPDDPALASWRLAVLETWPPRPYPALSLTIFPEGLERANGGHHGSPGSESPF
jgi:hypothetical protein